MIDWKPSSDGGLEAELTHGDFVATLWAWPGVSRDREVFCARVYVELGGENSYGEPRDAFYQNDDGAKSLEEAQQRAVELLQLYLDGDPEERAFKAKLRAWVTP